MKKKQGKNDHPTQKHGNLLRGGRYIKKGGKQGRGVLEGAGKFYFSTWVVTTGMF